MNAIGLAGWIFQDDLVKNNLQNTIELHNLTHKLFICTNSYLTLLAVHKQSKQVWFKVEEGYHNNGL